MKRQLTKTTKTDSKSEQKKKTYTKEEIAELKAFSQEMWEAEWMRS